MLDLVVAGNINVTIGNQRSNYSCPELLKLAEEEINKRFGEDTELAELIIRALPGVKTLQRWIKRNDWKDEVEKRLKDDNLYSLDKRAKVISMIYNRAVDDLDLKAAETYLKLSGDLTNKPQQVDKGYEAYQELAESLIKKHRKND